MTKADLIDKISKDTGIEKNKVANTVESFMDNIKTALVNGEDVYLRGFGRFAAKKRATKTARNIKKNTTVIVPACTVPTFKPYKSFKLK